MTEFKETIPLSKVAPGTSTTVEVDGKMVALFNVEGTIYAISDLCMHAGQSLGYGILQGKVVRCRGHGWRFDVTTGFVVGVPGAGVPSYQVRIEDDKIFVAVA
jgi:nitrite reductase/ring-hydroxylating ferredoxin subunit